MLASLFFTAISCRLAWRAAVLDEHTGGTAYVLFGVILLTVLTCTHLCLLCILLTRRTAHLLLTLLFIGSAVATYFMQAYGVYLDPGMLRNVIHSEPAEAADLLGGQLFWHVLLEGVLPSLILWAVRIRSRPVLRAAVVRLGTMSLSLVLLSLGVLLGYQDLAALARNHKEVRYLITPENYLYSLVRALSGEAAPVPGTLLPVGLDARRSAVLKDERKPVLLMIVVGETARSANWGLSGYARQTTPELSRLDVINFANVTSCGSDTETSLPCMFSAVGRRDYDQLRIRRSESLLHVVDRAGVKVLWRDNQTGCKGVCAGLPMEQVDQLWPDVCQPGSCLDEVLLKDLAPHLRASLQDRVVVLHQMGNHGPA